MLGNLSSVFGYGGNSNPINYATPGGMSPVEVDNPYLFQNGQGLATLGSNVPAGITDPTFLQGATGYTNPDGTKVDGWGGLALSGLSTAANLFMGMKQNTHFGGSRIADTKVRISQDRACY